MKAVIQRVSSASVMVENNEVGKIGTGILIYLGVMKGDVEKDCDYLSGKVARFRLFPDEKARMNLSLLDVHGEILVISQFTLAADGRKGNRPSFDKAAAPEIAIPLYEKFILHMKNLGLKTETGIFGAHMKVSSLNDGPVTFILDSVE